MAREILEYKKRGSDDEKDALLGPELGANSHVRCGVPRYLLL